MLISRAAVLTQFNAPLELREFPVPSEVEPGAAVVRTEMAGICGTDVHLWKGQLPLNLPVILGHETVGWLVTLGAGLDRDWTGEPLEIGDRVTWSSTVSCGHCFYCAEKRQPTRCPERRAYGIGYSVREPPSLWGGYADYHYLRPRTHLFKLPAELSTDTVIGAGCALVTAIHGVERICREQASGRAGGMPELPTLHRDSVVVQGAGPVAISCAAVVRNAGAGQVILIGGPGHRLAVARQFGVDGTIDLEETPSPAERIEKVLQLTRGYGADVVIECVGSPTVVEEGMKMCRDGGKYLILGHYADAGPVPFNPHLVTRKQLEVFGSWSSEPRHMQASLRFAQANQERFPFASLVSHRFPLERANEALDAMARWSSAKSAITPG